MALRTLDTRHFGGWMYLVHLIVIYTMMYHIPTEIIFCSPRTNGSGSVWLINASGDAWLFGTSGSLYVDGSYGLYSPDTTGSNSAWPVESSGDIDGRDIFGIEHSYGNMLSGHGL